jgi:hypothetical protein
MRRSMPVEFDVMVSRVATPDLIYVVSAQKNTRPVLYKLSASVIIGFDPKSDTIEEGTLLGVREDPDIPGHIVSARVRESSRGERVRSATVKSLAIRGRR